VKVSFADVAGVDEAEQELKEIVEFLKTPKKYTTLGAASKGVLLVGPPGTGKTLLARAVAGEAKVPFFSLSGSEFVEMFVGVGAAPSGLFSQAEAKARASSSSTSSTRSAARASRARWDRTRSASDAEQLLAEMDGFDSRKAIIIMGATTAPRCSIRAAAPRSLRSPGAGRQADGQGTRGKSCASTRRTSSCRRRSKSRASTAVCPCARPARRLVAGWRIRCPRTRRVRARRS